MRQPIRIEEPVTTAWNDRKEAIKEAYRKYPDEDHSAMGYAGTFLRNARRKTVLAIADGDFYKVVSDTHGQATVVEIREGGVSLFQLEEV